MTRRVLTTARAAEVLEMARDDIARLMQQTIETQAQLNRLIGITTELYEGIAKEPAPPVDVRARVG